MIGTYSRGIKLIEHGEQIYSRRLPIPSTFICDLLYVSHSNCNLIGLSEEIHRKDIDSGPPYLFMRLELGLRAGMSLSYSVIHQRLLIAKKNSIIQA